MQRSVHEEATDCEEHDGHHAPAVAVPSRFKIQDLKPQNENRTQNHVRTSVQAAYIETIISGVDNGSIVNNGGMQPALRISVTNALLVGN